ncbi:hypothetical protein F4778DRAFT_507479 [Xylariomycetidae sp. FL2044]|nr:hypothetical protein F4778DRAFT_507479 [Xylariomycetidae sp. FL2044]
MHPPLLYSPLKRALEARGYEVLIPRLATLGSDKSDIHWNADVSKLMDTATPLFEEGREVVLMGHSYGGIPSCIATKGNTVSDRRAMGKTGGFSQIIFLCAFALPARGMSVLSGSGGAVLPWQKITELESGSQQIFLNETAKKLLYSDVPEHKAQAMFDQLLPEITIPMTYIVCENDALFPAELQRSLVTACGSNLRQASVAGGHIGPEHEGLYARNSTAGSSFLEKLVRALRPLWAGLFPVLTVWKIQRPSTGGSGFNEEALR